MGTTAEKLNYLNETKKQIKQAIIDKGVDVTNDDTFRSYATKIGEIKSGGEIPDYMSAKNFTFDGNACIGYVGDNTLPEIVIPKSYSTITSTETVVGAKVLNKNEIRYIIRDFTSAAFSDGENNTHVYSSPMELETLTSDFPNDCYLVSMEVLDPFSFYFLREAFDMQVLQFPITINGQSFSDGEAAFDHIMQNYIIDVNFGGDVEVTKFVDGNTYQVTTVSGSNNESGFKNYQNRIILLSNLTSIGDRAFNDCNSLTSIEIPDSVTTIGDSAFGGCGSLTSIIIPDSVITIGEAAFSGCRSLTSITIPEGVTSIGNSAFGDCSSLTSIIIPDSVTTIGSFAFQGCGSLTSITLPSTVTSIGANAFYDCSSLTSITIPSTLTSIGGFAFSGCSGLESITVESGNSVYHSEGNCLIKTASKTLITGCKNSVIPTDGSVTSIGDGAFSGCSNLTSITIPEGVTSIGSSAFSGCSSLTSISIPARVTSIRYKAFYNCSNLTSVSLPSALTEIGDQAFSGCSSLTSITIPKGVTSIGYEAFRDCSSLASVTIPEGVTKIGSSAFRDCSSLTSISIPESVTSISYDAFYGCSGLTSMRVEATTPPRLSATNAISTATTQIQVPMASVEAYKTATNWSNFADIIVGY